MNAPKGRRVVMKDNSKSKFYFGRPNLVWIWSAVIDMQTREYPKTKELKATTREIPIRRGTFLIFIIIKTVYYLKFTNIEACL